MNLSISTFVFLMLLGFAGCAVRPDVEIGNGFVLRGHGTSVEGHPKRISLCLKKNGETIVVWPAMTAGHGGPFLLKDGVVFVRRNETDRLTLYVADRLGAVSQVPLERAKEEGRPFEVRQLKEVGESLNVDVWTASQRAESFEVPKAEDHDC